jgi:hypothetical protein
LASAPRAEAAGPPDLRATIAFAPWNVHPSQVFSFSVWITNDGGTAAKPNFYAMLHKSFTNVSITSANGSACTKTYYASGFLPGTWFQCKKSTFLSPGALDGIVIQAKAPAALGTYNLGAIADGYGLVAESNESNTTTRPVHVVP